MELSEVREHLDEFAEKLELKPLERKRLRAADKSPLSLRKP